MIKNDLRVRFEVIVVLARKKKINNNTTLFGARTCAAPSGRVLPRPPSPPRAVIITRVHLSHRGERARVHLHIGEPVVIPSRACRR